jgi:GNAT superfamily N-acetyltransferase
MMTESVPVRMIRDHLNDIPHYKLPEPYTIRPYQAGDETAWLDIQAATDRYNPITPELFGAQFGSDPKLLADRQFYLCDETTRPIGTATAWFGQGAWQGWGRLHWVAIVPAHQGRGLAKPLMTVTCRRLRELGHRRAYLTTATARIPAIGLYLKFGFRPDIQTEQDVESWRGVGGKVGPLAKRTDWWSAVDVRQVG